MAKKKLGIVYLFGTSITDLSPLEGREFLDLQVTGSKITDLSPLRRIKVKRNLTLSRLAVKDFSPLKGKSIKSLNIRGVGTTDLSPLAGMPLLEGITLDYKPQHKAVLQSMPRLKKINGRPKAMFFERAGQL